MSITNVSIRESRPCRSCKFSSRDHGEHGYDSYWCAFHCCSISWEHYNKCSWCVFNVTHEELQKLLDPTFTHLKSQTIWIV